MADQRFWRADLPDGDGEEPAAGYGPLKDVSCNKVNLKRIETHRPDMLRVAGSLVTNRVRAYDLLRMFGREGHATPLGAAFAEYCRIEKTMHLGCRPLLPAQGAAHQLPGPLPVQHQGQRRRPGPAPLP